MYRIKQWVIGLFAWYHRIHLRALWAKEVKKRSPKDVLSAQQKEKIIKFYAPYCKVNTLFHNYYTDKTGEFCEKYIPDDVHDAYIEPYFNCAEEAVWVDNKCFYERYFPSIKHPETVARRINSFWFVDWKVVSEQEMFEKLQVESGVFVKEATLSMGGQGVTFVENTGDAFVKDLEKAVSKIKGDIVIQKPLKQHEDMSRLNESSVNTIRCISLLKDSGEVRIYSSLLRMGIGGAKVDNASFGGIIIGITQDGKLKKVALNKYGEKFQAHPTSGVVFDGYDIPGYEKVVETVKRAHWMVPRFRLVSWDFCIDEAGDPVLIEANLHRGGLDIHQLCNGPLFGEDTEEILKKVFCGKR